MLHYLKSVKERSRFRAVPVVTGVSVELLPEPVIFMSVMTGSSPLHKDAWPFPQKLVSIILSRLADVGGPRCCKRTSRIAIEEAVHFYSQFCSVNIPLSSITCKYCEDNRECIQEDCPYYPE